MCQHASYSICAGAAEGGKHQPEPPSPSSTGSHPLPPNVVQEIVGIALPLLRSGGPGGPRPVGTSGWSQAPTLAGAAGAGRAARDGVKMGFPQLGLCCLFPGPSARDTWLLLEL